MDADRRTVTISVASRDKIRERARRAAAGEPQGAHITFPSVDLLWRIISPKRLEILRVLAGSDRLSIREVARRVGRDVKAVHGEIHGLADAGIVSIDAEGVFLGYDEIHVDFTLQAA